MKLNKYYIRARLFPTILTAPPAIVFFNNFIAPLYNENLANVFTTLPTITNATFSAAIIFLLIQLNRLCAKELFQSRFFEDELRMPTTNRLIWKDDYFDKEIKRKIRLKIRDKYNIELLSAEDEQADEVKGRKLITTAISQVRNSLITDPMLQQHNIEYGFFRNLIGGSLIAFIFSLLNLIFAHIYVDQKMKLIALLLLIAYITPILLSKFFIKKYGEYYSKILYEQFINLS